MARLFDHISLVEIIAAIWGIRLEPAFFSQRFNMRAWISHKLGALTLSK